jgi:hypothetical protein
LETALFTISNTVEYLNGSGSSSTSLILAPMNAYSVNLTNGTVTFSNLNFRYGGVADLYVICTMSPSNTSKIFFENCQVQRYGVGLIFRHEF